MTMRGSLKQSNTKITIVSKTMPEKTKAVERIIRTVDSAKLSVKSLVPRKEMVPICNFNPTFLPSHKENQPQNY